MNIKQDLIIIITLIAILGGIVYFSSGNEPEVLPIPSTEIPTDQTPEPLLEPTEAVVVAKMNAPAQALGVTIEPLELVEDSRCPSEVVCIQAGTVRVRAKITDPNGERALTMVLNTPVPGAYATIELTEVEPEARAEIPIRMNEYRFKFEIKK